MNVSVVIPTRGNVSLDPIIDSFPADWEIVVYDNGRGKAHRIEPGRRRNWWAYDAAANGLPDLSVYARYAAIEYATHDLILTQDDDVIVSDPQAIVERWVTEACGRITPGLERLAENGPLLAEDHVVCNMPQEFRPHYPDSALVGFGAAFHRDAPARAFGRYEAFVQEKGQGAFTGCAGPTFNRTCDVVFTTLTPRVLVDVPKENLPYATGDDRMYRQAEHVGERARMLELTRKVRDA